MALRLPQTAKNSGAEPSPQFTVTLVQVPCVSGKNSKGVLPSLHSKYTGAAVATPSPSSRVPHWAQAPEDADNASTPAIVTRVEIFENCFAVNMFSRTGEGC